MTAPEPGSTRPSRLAGIALLALAAVALVIGLITVFGGNGDGNADGGNGGDGPPGTSTSASRPSSGSTTTPPSSTPSTTPPPGSTSSGTPPTGGTSSPGQTAPPGDGNGESTKAVPVRVLNNSKVKGLASEAADDLKADGWKVDKVGNYSATNVATTTAYYRPGTAEEAAAREIASTFGMEVAPRLDTLGKEPPGVIIVVTNGYGTNGSKNEG